jgi:hypothetical protein
VVPPLRTPVHVEQRRPREKRKGLAVVLSSRGRRHLGFCSSLRRREEKREVGEESELGFDGERPTQGFLFNRESRSVVESERAVDVDRAVKPDRVGEKGFHNKSPSCGLVHADALGVSGPWAQLVL